MNKPIRLIAASALVVLALAGCSAKNQEPYKDGPVLGNHERTASQILEMPDGFSNIATKCVHEPNGSWTRYTVVYHGDHAYGAVSVVDSAKGCS